MEINDYDVNLTNPEKKNEVVETNVNNIVNDNIETSANLSEKTEEPAQIEVEPMAETQEVIAETPNPVIEAQWLSTGN